MTICLEVRNIKFKAVRNDAARPDQARWVVEAHQTLGPVDEQTRKTVIRIWRGASRLSVWGALLDAIKQGEDAGWLDED